MQATSVPWQPRSRHDVQPRVPVSLACGAPRRACKKEPERFQRTRNAFPKGRSSSAPQAHVRGALPRTRQSSRDFYVVAPSTTAPRGYVRRARLKRSGRRVRSGPQVRTLQCGDAPVPKDGTEVAAADPVALHERPDVLGSDPAVLGNEHGPAPVAAKQGEKIEPLEGCERALAGDAKRQPGPARRRAPGGRGYPTRTAAVRSALVAVMRRKSLRTR